MSSSLIIPSMCGMSDMWPEPGTSVGICGSSQSASQDSSCAISGPWAALICSASAVTSAGISGLARIMSLISIAWA